MPLIETEEAARRLARAIASDLSLYNEEKIVNGITNDNLFETLAEEIEEGRSLFKRRVAAELYPTANVDMGDYLRPAYGIYAVRATLADGRRVNGAANLGIRPTFDPPKELLEPFFFDFTGDLYGQVIAVELVDYLRAEANFDTLDGLVAQMDRDCARARELLAE